MRGKREDIVKYSVRSFALLCVRERYRVAQTCEDLRLAVNQHHVSAWSVMMVMQT